MISRSAAPERAPFLHAAGAALYGRHWQTDMAVALGVQPRTVRYWAAGRDVPTWAWELMAIIADDRAAEFLGLAERLREREGTIGKMETRDGMVAERKPNPALAPALGG